MVWLVALHADVPLCRDHVAPVTTNPLQCLSQFSAPAKQHAAHVRWWLGRLREPTFLGAPPQHQHQDKATSPGRARGVDRHRHAGVASHSIVSEPCGLDDDDWDLV